MMAERQNLLSNLGLRPVPMNMKLFATGDMDRTPPNCIPRLCNVTITRLHLLSKPSPDLSSVIVAVKMHSSKRTLRSNELPLPPSGTLDTELQLCYSLQYPHFLKRDANSLQILLQRRKKYKNRTILGFKTLAVGLVNMAQVLQRPMDQELELYSQGKEKGSPVARVTLESLSSQPVDCDDSDTIRHIKPFISDNPDRSVDIVEDSEDDQEYSSQDDGSDSEPMLDESTGTAAHHRHRHRQGQPSARQRNLKQRFVALLKKFKVPEALQAFDAESDLDPRTDVPVDPDDIEYLMNELEDLSDSGPEVDTLSISSTPKPSLRPYFSSSRSLLMDENSTAATAAGAGPHLPPPHHHHHRLKLPDKPYNEGLSDESSKRGDSDHLPDYTDHWTDAEHSDTQAGGGAVLSSSPPTHHKMSPPEVQASSSIAAAAAKDNITTTSSTSHEKVKETPSNKPSHKSNKSIGGGAAGLVFGSSRSEKRTTSTSSATSSTPVSATSATVASNASVSTPANSSNRQDSLHGHPDNAVVRKGLLEHLASILPSEDIRLPPAVILLDTSDYSNSCIVSSSSVPSSGGPSNTSSSELNHAALAAHLSGSASLPVITTYSAADVRVTMQHLISKLQRFCNSNAKAPGPMKVVIMGSDTYVNSVLRPYVADLSTRPPDYQNHIRFLIVPLGGVSSLAKYLGSVDSSYGACFVSEWWKDAIERWEASDMVEAVARVNKYLNQAHHTLHLPIAEAVLTYKEKSCDDGSAQTFIPFVTDVRLGSGDVTSTSIDLDDVPPSSSSAAPSSSSFAPGGGASQSSSQQGTGNTNTNSQPSSSTNLSNLVNLNLLTATTASSGPSTTTTSSGGSGQPGSLGASGIASLGSSGGGGASGTSGGLDKSRGGDVPPTITPPSSPNINTSHLPTSRTMSESEALDLQVDYWLRSDKRGSGDDRDKEGSKSTSQGGRCTLKTCFRTLQVARLAPLGIVLNQDNALTFSYATKENKKRIMRIGKKKEKERETESRRDVVDGVTRLLANTKNAPVTVTIDSVEWPNVKFFQLSSQWQTQIKSFPVCLFNLQSSTSER